MGGKSSKQKAEESSKQINVVNKQTKPQPTVEIKGGTIPQVFSAPQKRRQTKLTQEVILASQIRCLLDLFLSSERLKEVLSDEDIVTQPLKAYSGKNHSVAIMRSIIDSIGQESTPKKVEEQFLKAVSTKVPVSDLFNIIQTAFKLVHIDNSSSAKSVLATLKALVDLPVSEIEGSEIETVLFEGLLRDIDEKNKEDNSEEQTDAKLEIIRKYLVSEKSVWPLSSNLPRLSKLVDQMFLMPLDELHAGLEEYLLAIKAKIIEDLEGKIYDPEIVGPVNIDISPAQLKLYKCLPSLSFGYLKVDGRKLLARVKKVSLQIFRDPDFESIRSIELSEFVSINNRILGCDEPFFRSVTVENMVEKLALVEENPNIKSDYEPVCLYIRDNKIHYCLKKAALADRGEAFGNSNMMRLCLVKQHDLYLPEVYKIAIAPNGLLDVPTNFVYFVAVEKTATLLSVKAKLEAMFSKGLEASSNMIDQILESLVFSLEIPNKRTDSRAFHKKSEQVLKGKGWKTQISDIVNACGKDHSQEFDPAKENEIDLLITMNRDSFKPMLHSNNFIDTDRSQFIKIKPTISDLMEQVIGEEFRSQPDSFTEERIRELTPTYLYVDLTETSNIFDVTTDLKYNFFNSVFEDLGIEYSPKYRAIGFIYSKPNEESVTVVPDVRYSDKFYIKKKGTTDAIKPNKFDSNLITGVYYQRCHKEL